MWDELLSERMNPMEVARAAKSWGLQTRKRPHSGGKPLSYQNVYRLFANPYYMGLIRLKSGETYRGAHQPMITPSQFERASGDCARDLREPDPEGPKSALPSQRTLLVLRAAGDFSRLAAPRGIEPRLPA